MGIGIFGISRSRYDKPAVVVREIIREVPKYVREDILSTEKVRKKLENVNPNPFKYKFKRTRRFGKATGLGHYLLIEVNYPNCTNYEGNKILIYEDVKLIDLTRQGSIDPHFSNSKKFHSPIARFVPTKKGWEMACRFCMLMGNLS